MRFDPKKSTIESLANRCFAEHGIKLSDQGLNGRHCIGVPIEDLVKRKRASGPFSDSWKIKL